MGWTKERKQLFHNICVELTLNYYERLEKHCAEKGLTKSQLVRLALKEYFERQER